MQGKGLIREERGFHDGVVYKCLLFKFNSKGFGYSKVTCFKGGGGLCDVGYPRCVFLNTQFCHLVCSCTFIGPCPMHTCDGFVSSFTNLVH